LTGTARQLDAAAAEAGAGAQDLAVVITQLEGMAGLTCAGYGGDPNATLR